jgi:hypothetical protein
MGGIRDRLTFHGVAVAAIREFSDLTAATLNALRRCRKRMLQFFCRWTGRRDFVRVRWKATDFEEASATRVTLALPTRVSAQSFEQIRKRVVDPCAGDEILVIG